MADMDITGNYELQNSENFDDYMKSVGVGFVLRQMAGRVSSATVEITKNGDEYTMKTITTLKTIEIKFKLNTPFTEETMDGRKVTSTFTLEGNTLKQVQRGEKDFVSNIDREFIGDKMIVTMKHEKVTATRNYTKKVEKKKEKE